MTTWTRETITTSMQESIVTAMIVDTGVLKEISKSEARLLDVPDMVTVANWCLTYFEKYGKAPKENIKTIYEVHRRNGLDPDSAATIGRFLENINGEYEITGNAGFHIDLAKEYFRDQERQRLRDDLSQHLSNGNAAAFDELIKKFADESHAEQGKDLAGAVREAVMPFREFSKIEIPKARLIVGEWLEESSINLISSPPGVGKTWLAMETAAAAANCRDAMSGLWKVDRLRPCLYIDGEMSPAVIQERGKMVGQVGLGNCELLSKVWMEAQDVPPLNLAEEAVRETLLDYIVERQFRLVVIDNLFSLFVGLDTNSATDWGPPNQWLLKLRAKGVATLLLHHTGKSETQLGTSSREFNANLSLILKDARTAESGDNCAFTIKVTKQRSRGLGLQGKKFLVVDGRWTVTDDKKARQEAAKSDIARMLVEGMSGVKIAAALKCTPAWVSQLRKELIKDQYIREINDGRKVELTGKGESWLQGSN